MKNVLRCLGVAAMLTCLSLPAAPAENGKAGASWSAALSSAAGQAAAATLFALGKASDDRAREDFDKDRALFHVEMLLKLSENTKEKLTALVASGHLSKDDIATVQQFITANDLLSKAAKNLTAYINLRSAENAAATDESIHQAAGSVVKILKLIGVSVPVAAH